MRVLEVGDFVGMIEPKRVAVPIPMAWYLLRIHPNRECTVADRLLHRGATVYLPTEIRTRRSVWSRRVPVAAPIFPGILFVADFDADLRRLRALSDGIVGYIPGCASEPAVANRKTMGDIHKLAERLNVPMGQRKYRIGQGVRVGEGPFSYWTGRIERLASHGRLRVLLDVIECQVPVEIAENQIEAV